MNPLPHAPSATLDEECRLAESLVACLRSEQECLIRADIEPLAVASTQKAELVNRLSDLAESRHRALAAAGHPGGEAGMPAWLSAQDKASPIRLQWQTLLASAREAQELNRVNGLLIGGHLSRTQGMLQALRSAAGHGTAVYGPNGQQSAGGLKRALVVG